MLNSIHLFECRSRMIPDAIGYVACGILICNDEWEYLTKDPKKVTCKNCKRTSFFKEE